MLVNRLPHDVPYQVTPEYRYRELEPQATQIALILPIYQGRAVNNIHILGLPKSCFIDMIMCKQLPRVWGHASLGGDLDNRTSSCLRLSINANILGVPCIVYIQL